MSGAPLFSVIVPTYNRSDLLKKTLDSVWAQPGDDFEVIVVDDGSTDDTISYLNSLRSKVEVVRQTNRGPGAARNAGAARATGKYLAFLDSDDLWLPWSLPIYQEVIARHGAVSFIAGRPFVFTSETQLASLKAGEMRGRLFADYLSSGDEWRWWGVSSFVVRRDAFLEVRGFIESLVNGEDADLAMRLGVAPGFFQIEAPVTFGYREHGASAKKDSGRTVMGAWSQIEAERTGQYPGGKQRVRERQRIITRHIRPVTFACIREGCQHDAWALYFSTLVANVAQGRVKYLTGFPLMALAQKLVGGGTGKP